MQIKKHYAVHPDHYKTLDTAQLREQFAMEKLFSDNEIHLYYTHYDRYIAGGIMPVSKVITMPTIDEIKAPYFLERREMGVINVGGAGSVTVDGTTYELEYKDALYIGKGSESITFASNNADAPAKFYMNSTPAHHAFPTKKIGKDQANHIELGSLETSNHRTVIQMIVSSIVETCQLQMGMTELKPGSVWNTMPAHTHERRMEVYFYFELGTENAVSHFMGPIDETRHIFLHNEQAVVSPPYSIHCGAGTSNYTFIWGMAGENLDYGDMDTAKYTELR